MTDVRTVREISLEEYPRREHFKYFHSLAYPYVGVTVLVDITEWLEKIRERKQPFFLSFLYCAVNSANEVPELCQRIAGEKILEFSSCQASYTVALEDGTYTYCAVDCAMPLEKFLPYAAEKQRLAKLHPSIEDGEDALSQFFISSLPWISYTSIVQPVPCPADSNPRITWGKYCSQNGRIMIPVSLLCHHGLVDGVHMARFYENLEMWLRRI
ncbi:MAG: CatA-like O-acetyltransferase [Eubacteriales bacterium]|nr:CatA-like O-acetyltransferase [Eubacteriales bacterium]